MKRANTSAGKLRLGRAALSAVTVVACAAAAFAQAAQQVSVESVQFTSPPVEIVGVEVAGETHQFAGPTQQAFSPSLFHTSFDAREDWLRQFALKIRNKSDKAIISVTLHGTLAAGEEGEVPMGIEAVYGRELDDSAYTGRAPRGEPRRLAPGEAAEVRWSAAEYEQLAKFLSTKRPVAAYRRMRIDLREVFFEDGTVWTVDGMFRIDPNDPRKWTRLDRTAAGAPAAPPELKPGERVVENHLARAVPGLDSETLAITGITVNGQGVAPGRPFAAGAGWLRGLTVRVRNVSPKPISYIQLGFSAPEARYRAGGIGFRFSFGVMRPKGVPAANDAKSLAPGEEVDLGFTGDDYEAHMQLVERHSGVTEITRVRFGTATIVFADGTRALVATPLLTRKPQPSGGAK